MDPREARSLTRLIIGADRTIGRANRRGRPARLDEPLEETYMARLIIQHEATIRGLDPVQDAVRVEKVRGQLLFCREMLDAWRRE